MRVAHRLLRTLLNESKLVLTRSVLGHGGCCGRVATKISLRCHRAESQQNKHDLKGGAERQHGLEGIREEQGGATVLVIVETGLGRLGYIHIYSEERVLTD